MAEQQQIREDLTPHTETAIAAGDETRNARKVSIPKFGKRISMWGAIIAVVIWGFINAPIWGAYWFPESTREVPAVNPRLASNCIEVGALPSGRNGDFCVEMKAGQESELVKPNPSTHVEIFPGGSAGVKFFDWKGELIEVVKNTDPKGFPCTPRGWSSFKITLEKDGKVRMRAGLPPSAEYRKCLN